VLDNDDVVIIAEERSDDQSSTQTLLDIEIRGGLVEHIDIGFLDSNSSDSKTLEFTTREEVNITVHDVVQLEDIGNLFHVTERGSTLNEVSDTLVGAFNSPGDLVHILRLDHGLEVILQKLGEIVLKLGTTEVLDNILPVRDVIVSAQVGLELSTQNLEGSTLSDTVGTDKSKHLTGSGHGKTVQLEAVGAISVGDLALKVGGQVDDIDRIEGAALRADTTTDT
jgi:hypothetical protein